MLLDGHAYKIQNSALPSNGGPLIGRHLLKVTVKQTQECVGNNFESSVKKTARGEASLDFILAELNCLKMQRQEMGD